MENAALARKSNTINDSDDKKIYPFPTTAERTITKFYNRFDYNILCQAVLCVRDEYLSLVNTSFFTKKNLNNFVLSTYINLSIDIRYFVLNHDKKN